MDPEGSENSLIPDVTSVRTPAEPFVAPPEPVEPTTPTQFPPCEPPANTEELLLGDANGDCSVSFADFLVVAQNFGQTTDLGREDGDFYDDGITDFADFLQLNVNFGTFFA